MAYNIVEQTERVKNEHEKFLKKCRGLDYRGELKLMLKSRYQPSQGDILEWLAFLLAKQDRECIEMILNDTHASKLIASIEDKEVLRGWARDLEDLGIMPPWLAIDDDPRIHE
jgi:hypothetical protein